MKLLEQRNVKWLGAFIHVLYLASPLLGLVAYAMTAFTLYAVTSQTIKGIIPWWSLQIFLGLLVIALLVTMVLFYVLVYKSYFAFLNRQTYIHNNPIQQDLAKIKEKLGIKDE